MKILVLGSGGREHCLVWKIKQTAENLYCIPGNGGISDIAICINIDLNQHNAIIDYIKKEKIDFVVVGPEKPLVDGISDSLSREGIPVFGPNRQQATLEGSKVYAKKFMEKYNIPTAEFIVAENPDYAFSAVDHFFKKHLQGIVIKADGLAAGKGSIVCNDINSAKEAINNIMIKKIFGKSGDKIVIERKLTGMEISAIAFCDGDTILPLLYSQDHKPLLDNDEGPNTGGMGAYAPLPFITKNLQNKIQTEIFDNFIKGIKGESIGYNGVIYFGLMIENLDTEPQPYVLEFNCRFGDPETQATLPLLKNDIVDLFEKTMNSKLREAKLETEEKYCVCVVMASQGYPDEYQTGKEIYGLDRVSEEIIVFHAGTKKILKENKSIYITSGGRVLGVTAKDESLKSAIEKVYSAVDIISFEGKYCRRDIGKKSLKYLKLI